VSQKPITDDVFERILTLIYSGELAPGEAVNEAVLAQSFGVSRGPVREAVRRLQGIQLVSREPYTKARVVSFSSAEILELFQMRGALEGLACRLAAERMSDEEIAQLSNDLETSRRAKFGQGDGSPAKDFDFHERIVRASHNNRIIKALCGDLYHLLRIYRRRSGAVPERGDLAYSEHWQILRAIKARDGELAESIMRSHVARAAEHLVDQLQRLEQPAASKSTTNLA